MRQIRSWYDNPDIASLSQIDLSLINFPAITICHDGNTRMSIADRLYNSIEESSPKGRKLRNWLIKGALSEEMRENCVTKKCLFEYYWDHCTELYSVKDPYCMFLDAFYGYLNSTQNTAKNYTESIFQELLDVENTSEFFKEKLEEIEKNQDEFERQNLNENLDKTSDEWVYLETIGRLFRQLNEKPLKNPLSFSRTINDQFENPSKTEIDEILDYFRLPNMNVNLMTLSHF